MGDKQTTERRRNVSAFDYHKSFARQFKTPAHHRPPEETHIRSPRFRIIMTARPDLPGHEHRRSQRRLPDS